MALMVGALGSPGEPCCECYQPLEEGEISSLSRVHTGVNLSQLVFCEKDEKGWMAHNTAAFMQPLLGECPVGEASLGSERDVTEASLVNLVQKMVKVVRKMVCKKYLAVLSLKRKERDKCIYYEVYEFHECTEKEINHFREMKELCKCWESPKPLFLISGITAYTKLSGDWSGGYTTGMITQDFSLLHKESGSRFGVPRYKDLRETKQKKQSTTEIERSQNCKGQVQTPISMLNRNIRLQAVLEIRNAIIRNFSNEIRKLAHVNNEEQTPTLDSSWWDNLWTFKKDFWEKVTFPTVRILGGLLFYRAYVPASLK